MFGQDDLNENEARKSLIFLSFFNEVGAEAHAEGAISSGPVSPEAGFGAQFLFPFGRQEWWCDFFTAEVTEDSAEVTI